MPIKKLLHKIGIIIIMLLILFTGCVVYRMIDNYMIYSVKTIGQTKYKLTVYVENQRTGKAAPSVLVEIVQKVGFIEKEITYRKTNENGIVVFHLLPGQYRCRGEDFYLGHMDFIDLDKDKEYKFRTLILPPQPMK